MCDLCFDNVWFIRFTRCSPFWFLILLEYLSVQFSSRLTAGSTCIHGSIHVSRQVGLICFCIFNSSVLDFCRNSFFRFCLANSECNAYLAVDHSLVYSSYPKMILLFFSLANLEPDLKPSFFILDTSVSLCLLLLDLANCIIGILSSVFLSLKSLFSIFNSKWMQTHIRGIQLYVFAYHAWVQTYAYIVFWSYLFILFFSLALHTKCTNLLPQHVPSFRIWLWKIFSLFGQILITCLKCSRTSFLPSSYSEKMR